MRASKKAAGLGQTTAQACATGLWTGLTRGSYKAVIPLSIYFVMLTVTLGSFATVIVAKNPSKIAFASDTLKVCMEFPIGTGTDQL